MSHRILVIPTLSGAGASAVCLGLVHALDVQGVKVGYIKPLAQPHTDDRPDNGPDLIRLVTSLNPPAPVDAATLHAHLGNGTLPDLMEDVLTVAEPVLADSDVVVIEGLAPNDRLVHSSPVNRTLAATLDADVVLIADGRPNPEHVAETVAATASNFRHGDRDRVIGVVVNRMRDLAEADAYRQALARRRLELLAAVPERADINLPRVKDVVDQLGLTVLNVGEMDRRVATSVVAAQAVPGVIDGMSEGALIVVPGDRSEIILLASLMTMNGHRLAALLLTVGIVPDERLMALCEPAAAAGLPVLLSPDYTYQVAGAVGDLDPDIPTDDVQRTTAVMELVTEHLDEAWVRNLSGSGHARRLSPAAFRRQLTSLAAAADKRIVLPEGSEPRTVHAAVVCHEKSIARCVLLAPPHEVNAVAASLGLRLPDGLEVIDPADISEKYVDALVERRKHKGMTPLRAREELADTVVLGTMMVAQDDVDGLVSGAVHTTANTVRPALQLLGTKPGAALVSSVFFMLLPDEVVLYGDCAINPNPDAAELADIAIQSADSAKAFGVEPRVAMISFSTGSSGSGADVVKVTEATALVRAKRADLVVDGPMQYDAATTMSVARSKAPDSDVAGRATVFVFPDLNTGNTTYKAVQRSAEVVSVGPMLQGIAKPVNDLSRGALVDDIVYTIALTAIQAANV
ncbi:MAG: phosphate acetyltransferase [Actinomycetales bacterium]